MIGDKPQKIIPPSGNVAAEFMQKLFFQTEQRIIAEITRKRNQGFVDYSAHATLRRVQQILRDMVDDSEKYVPQMMAYPFMTGKGTFKGYGSAEEIIQRTDAETRRLIEQLSDNLLGEITEAAATAYQSSADLITAQNALKAAENGKTLIGRHSPDIYRKNVLPGVLTTTATGAGPLTSVEAVARSIEKEGIPAFIDRAGRKWSLRDYGNMATRTTFRQAQTAAELSKDDHDLYEVLRHPAPCRVCAIYSGRVYSKSGTNPNYPSLAQAFGKVDPAGPDVLSNTYLNIHPNCLCVLTRYTEKGKTPEQVQRMRDKSSFEKNPPKGDPRSKKEIEAYRQKERNRRQLRADIKEWEKMREALGDKAPATFATFQKHKKLNDDKYKEWMKAYRAKGVELRKEIKAQEMIPNPAPPTVTILGGREMPPNTWQFSNIGDFRKAEAAYIERHGKEQYYALRKMQENHTSEWRIPAWDEDRDIKMERAIRFDDTITKLKERFPLPDGGNLTAGDFDSVQGALTATQRERAAGTAAAQAWLNPSTNENVIGYRMTHGGTLADDLAVREKAINEGRALAAVFEKDSAEGIAIHEYGHRMAAYIENAMIYNDPAALEYWEWYKALSEKEIQDGISRYATTNRAEFEAECFADLLTGTPRPLARKYGEFLKRCAASNYTIKGELTGKGTPVQLNFNRGK